MPEEETDEKESEGKGKKSSDTLRKALIGLIGTLLTACGGLTGALVSAGFTVYQVEREAQQVALAAPGGDQALTVDTRQIAIKPGEAKGLAADEYAVDMDLGLVMAQPDTGWSQIETITFVTVQGADAVGSKDGAGRPQLAASQASVR
jgi:hypothetical protein